MLTVLHVMLLRVIHKLVLPRSSASAHITSGTATLHLPLVKIARVCMLMRIPLQQLIDPDLLLLRHTRRHHGVPRRSGRHQRRFMFVHI